MWGPDPVSLKDYWNQNHISTERVSQLIQVRREHVVNGNTVPSQSKTNFPRENQKNPKKNLLRHYAARLQKDGFFGFP